MKGEPRRLIRHGRFLGSPAVMWGWDEPLPTLVGCGLAVGWMWVMLKVGKV